MAEANFAACLAQTLKHEGGWSDHPVDPGGATMKGVTLKTYRRWKTNATKADLRKISDAEVAAIYRADYWDAVKGDDLPAGLDLVAFDAAVNSGPSRGAKWLQSALGAIADGKIGPATLALAARAEPGMVIDRACEIRMAYLRGLRTWPTFGKGWDIRVTLIRATAKGMAAPVRPAPRPIVDAAPSPAIPIGLLFVAGVAAVTAIKFFGG